MTEADSLVAHCADSHVGCCGSWRLDASSYPIMHAEPLLGTTSKTIIATLTLYSFRLNQTLANLRLGLSL